MDENTGGLKTTNMIDRESKFVSNGMYNMTVRAVDTSKSGIYVNDDLSAHKWECFFLSRI